MAAPASGVMGAPVFRAIAWELLDHWEARDFRSHDPFDGLETRLVRDARRLPRPLRLGLVQLHKRSPVNLRPAMRVPPTRNAYADALFAQAALLLARGGEGGRYPDIARDALDWLREARIRGGWAYPFDVQTRTFFYPKTVPNVVTTAFASEAFLAAFAAAGEREHLDVAVDAARFALEELLTGEPDRPWFGYLPGEPSLIHNANLLAARLCVRVGALLEDEAFLEPGRRAVRTTLGHERPDGSFLYGVGPRLGWIDGHHTGFVVECLADVASHVPEATEALPRAAAFYARHLFGPDGAPYPAPGRRFPVDAIAGAQGIQTFARLGALDRAARTARWMVRHMRTAAGTFAYQRRRLHRKTVPYARWSDAPMALALATLATRAEDVDAG